MDVNVGSGSGFENAVSDDTQTCQAFLPVFGEDPAVVQKISDVGSQPCALATPNVGGCINFGLYSVYRPVVWPAGRIPLVAWGNGTCFPPEAYGALLRYVASHGFFIVAPNSRQVGDGTALRRALDFAAAADVDPASPYFGHLDLSKVGVMGHSQGASGTVAAAADSRVLDVILLNGGTTATKPYLAVSGDLDIVTNTPSSMAAAINAQPKAAYIYFHNPVGSSSIRGHFLPVLSPERIAPAATAWWQMLLDDDATARAMFVGASCGLCGNPADHEYGEHGL
jgi:hypothetical protein